MMLRTVLALWAVLSLYPVAATSAEATALEPLPSWQKLEFELRALWVTARSSISLNACSEQYWCMQSSSSVAKSSEQLSMQFVPANGALTKRKRLSRGKQQRLKQWDYSSVGVVRERRSADAPSTADPADWPLTSRREIPYPPDTAVVTDSHLLLLLAAPARTNGAGPRQIVVNTDKNFYQVEISDGGQQTIQVSYQVAGTEQPVETERTVRIVEIVAKPIGVALEKPDFSLLGLTGKISIAYDQESDLPLQLRGKAPRIGNTEIALKFMQPRVPRP